MFHKYFKLILLLTILIQASPKAFDSLGNKLESFQEECKEYQKVSSLPVTIKKKCKTFNSNTNKAFIIGYKLDPYVDSDNISETKLNKYLTLLRKLDKNKEDILDLIYSEAKKARKQNNIKYYSQLIANDKIELYSSDYKYMEENKDIFSKNERYIRHMSYLKSLEESRKPIVIKNNSTRKSNSSFDRAAYNEYKKTKIYQTNVNRAKREPFTNLEASIRPNSNILDWKIILKSINEQTGSWADLGAIARGYHNNYIYIVLSLSIKYGNKEVYQSPKIKRKMYFNKRNNVLAYTTLPTGVKFTSTTINFNLDLSRESYINQAKEDIQDNKKVQIYQKQKKVTSQPHNSNSIITNNCKNKWGTNYRMIKYCIKQQQQSLNYVSAISNGGIIKQQCQSKWGTNYRMIKYCIKQQTEAFNYLKNTSNSLTKEHCENKWGTNYRMVKYCIGK